MEQSLRRERTEHEAARRASMEAMAKFDMAHNELERLRKEASRVSALREHWHSQLETLQHHAHGAPSEASLRKEEVCDSVGGVHELNGAIEWVQQCGLGRGELELLYTVLSQLFNGRPRPPRANAALVDALWRRVECLEHQVSSVSGAGGDRGSRVTASEAKLAVCDGSPPEAALTDLMRENNELRTERDELLAKHNVLMRLVEAQDAELVECHRILSEQCTCGAAAAGEGVKGEGLDTREVSAPDSKSQKKQARIIIEKRALKEMVGEHHPDHEEFCIPQPPSSEHKPPIEPAARQRVPLPSKRLSSTSHKGVQGNRTLKHELASGDSKRDKIKAEISRVHDEQSVSPNLNNSPD